MASMGLLSDCKDPRVTCATRSAYAKYTSMCSRFHIGAERFLSQKSWLVAAIRKRMNSAKNPSA